MEKHITKVTVWLTHVTLVDLTTNEVIEKTLNGRYSQARVKTEFESDQLVVVKSWSIKKEIKAYTDDIVNVAIKGDNE